MSCCNENQKALLMMIGKVAKWQNGKVAKWQ
jgi:hypothetical protein